MVVLASTAMLGVTGVDTAKAEEVFGDFGYISNSEYITITSYKGTLTDVVVPATIDGLPVKVIGDNSFNSVVIGTKITSITLPDSIQEIKSNAFKNTNLGTLNLPVNLEVIGASAFSLSGLTSINWNAKIRDVGELAFNGNNITSLTVPTGVNWGNAVFSHSNIKNLIVSEGVKNIPNNFLYGNSLTDLYLPDSVEVIGNSAFSLNTLQNVILGSGLKEIQTNAFKGNPDLNTLDLSKTITKYELTATADTKVDHITLHSDIDLQQLLTYKPSRNTITGLKSVAYTSKDSTPRGLVIDPFYSGLVFYGYKGSDFEKMVKDSGSTFKYLMDVEGVYDKETDSIKVSSTYADTTTPSTSFYGLSDSSDPTSVKMWNAVQLKSTPILQLQGKKYLHVRLNQTFPKNDPSFTSKVYRSISTLSIEELGGGSSNKPSTSDSKGISELNVGLKPGDFAVRYDSIGDFGSAKLSNETQSMSVPITNLRVVDDRGTREGWTLTVSATPVVTDDGTSLPVGSLSIGEFTSQSDATPVTNPSNTVDGSSLTLLKAVEGQGAGTTAIDFTGANEDALTIRFNSITAKSKTYKSTVTFNLVSGPTN